ncbi:PepSY-associated TM helix domain-containing protein [Malaciobacter sp. WC5094]
MKLNNLNLKYLMRAHSILGLFALYFFYLACFFGTITIFLPYLKSWESPSRHFSVNINNINLDEMVPKIIQRNELSDIIEIWLPSNHDKALGINDENSKTIYLNPQTQKTLNIDFETNFLTSFFNSIHIGSNIPIIGRILMGIASILMVFLSISGLIMWINLKKKKTKKEKFWLKWHKNLSLLLLPFILVFALTGAVLGFMLSTSAPIAYSASEMKSSNLRTLVGPILFPRDKKVETSQETPSLKISKLEKIAKDLYPNLEIKKIKLFAWNDKNAQIKFIGYLKDNRALTGRVNRMNLVLSGQTGEVISKHNLETSTTPNKILSAFYFLHFIPDEGPIFRIIYFILGVLMTAGLAFGFLIYSEKKQLKAKRENKNYYSILNKLSLSVIIGVIPSTCLILFLYWYFPFDMFERNLWLSGSFYSLWAASLFYIALKNNTLKVINQMLLLSSIFLVLAVAFHGFKTKYYPWISFNEKIYDVFFTDIVLLVFALIFYIFYKKSNNIKLLHKYDGDRYENQ